MEVQRDGSGASDQVTAAAISAAPRRIEGRGKVMGAAVPPAPSTTDTLGFEADIAVAVIAARATGRTAAIGTLEAAAATDVRLVMTHDGRLVSIMQDAIIAQGAKRSYVEPASQTMTKSYACRKILVHCRSAQPDSWRAV